MASRPKHRPAPDYLDELAVEIYTELLTEYRKKLRVSDYILLATYAQAASDYDRLTSTIREEGETTPDHNGAERRHPLGIERAKAVEVMDKMCKSLGLERREFEKAASKAASGPAAKKPPAKMRTLRKEPRQTGTK